MVSEKKNKYLIQHKIKTLAHLSVGLNNVSKPEMNIDDFYFYQWEFCSARGWLGDSWLVERNIEAFSVQEAIILFRSKLDKIIPKIAFISQCYMDFYQESFFIKRENFKNNCFFFRYLSNEVGNPLMFQDDEFLFYKKISNEDITAFKYLQECNNCPDYIPKLILLFSALEALCDRKERVGDNGFSYFVYNRETMKKILGNSLYNQIFGQNGLRHRLDHGHSLDFVFQKDYVSDIYKKIIKYLNNIYKVNINEDVKSPQRNFYKNIYYSDFWLLPEEGVGVSLKYCIENLNKDNLTINKCDNLDPITNY